jgi:hypothetical protein
VTFTLTLTNPSTQQELLKSELMRDKAQTYTELTRAEGGIAAMSHTTCKDVIICSIWSDREIVNDLETTKNGESCYARTSWILLLQLRNQDCLRILIIDLVNLKLQ